MLSPVQIPAQTVQFWSWQQTHKTDKLLLKLCLSLDLSEGGAWSSPSHDLLPQQPSLGLWNYSPVAAPCNFQKGHPSIPPWFNRKAGVTWEQAVPPAALFHKELISSPHSLGRKRLWVRAVTSLKAPKWLQAGNSSPETPVSMGEAQLRIQEHLPGGWGAPTDQPQATAGE